MFTGVEKQLEGLKDFKTLDSIQKEMLLKELRKIKLLTPAHASAKLAKNKQFKKFDSHILYMSPANIAFKFIGKAGTLCPWASEGCQAACLNTAGRGRFDSVANARLRKALYYILAREQFVAHLFDEVGKLEHKARKAGKQLVIRLNGTTDLPWYQIAGPGHAPQIIFNAYPSVQFYDYTKSLSQAINSKNFKNYHVTFSASESNYLNWKRALDTGINVAMVFDKKPTAYYGVQVIDGDTHDLRFLDKTNGSGLIVGLTAKGKAKRDTSGFVKKTLTSCSMVA